MLTIDELLDVFCVDDQQQKRLEKQHGLRMAEAGYAFCQNQTSEQVDKCVNAVAPFSSADKMFLRRHFQPEGLLCFFIKTAAASGLASGCVSDCSSVHTEQSHSSSINTSEFVPDAEPANQN